jgi:hypothetical protein
MDVASWLRSLNLGQYEAVFRESEIDAEILPELTDQDLEKLGIPLGHRKRLLKAIANLGQIEQAAAAVAAPVRAGQVETLEAKTRTNDFGRCALDRSHKH